MEWFEESRRGILKAKGHRENENAGAIVSYGERRRCGERISTGFVELTINQLIAKRFRRYRRKESSVEETPVEMYL
jgi:hypothetical protein